MRTQRFCWENILKRAGAAVTASSEDPAAPVEHLLSQTRTQTLRTAIGWEFTAGLNDKLPFLEGASQLVATVTGGPYATGALAAAAIQAAMNAVAVANTYQVTYNESLALFQPSIFQPSIFQTGDGGGYRFIIRRLTGSAAFELQWVSGSAAAVEASCGVDLGFDVTADDTGATAYSGDEASHQSRKVLTVALASDVRGVQVGILSDHNLAPHGVARVDGHVVAMGGLAQGVRVQTTLLGQDLVREAFIDAPAEISTLGPSLWLDAERITAGVDGAAVDLWPDRSGNGRHAIGVGSERPVFVRDGIGGRPALRFRGNENMETTVDLSEVLGANSGTVFVVYELDADARLPRYLFGGTASGHVGLGVMIGLQLQARNDDGSSVGAASKPTTAGVPHLGMWMHSLPNIWVGHDAVKSVDLAQHISGPTASLTGPFCVGRLSSSSTAGKHRGLIAEILAFPTALSEADRVKVELYLARKYGVALRHWRLVIDDVQNDEGFFEAGLFYLGPYYEPSQSVSQGYGEDPIELSEMDVSASGSVSQNYRPGGESFSLPIQLLTRADRAEFKRMVDTVAVGGCFWLILDSEARFLEETYYGCFTAGLRRSHTVMQSDPPDGYNFEIPFRESL